MCGEGKDWHEVGEAGGWDLHIPLLHAKVELLKQHGVLCHVFVPMVRVRAMGVFGEDAPHKLCNAHVNKFAHLFHHYFAVDPILWLVELKLSFFFLGIEHDFACVGQAFLHAVFEFVVVSVRVVLVVPRPLRVLVVVFFCYALFFALLQKFQQLTHGTLNKFLSDISVFDLLSCM